MGYFEVLVQGSAAALFIDYVSGCPVDKAEGLVYRILLLKNECFCWLRLVQVGPVKAAVLWRFFVHWAVVVKVSDGVSLLAILLSGLPRLLLKRLRACIESKVLRTLLDMFVGVKFYFTDNLLVSSCRDDVFKNPRSVILFQANSQLARGPPSNHKLPRLTHFDASRHFL